VTGQGGRPSGGQANLVSQKHETRNVKGLQVACQITTPQVLLFRPTTHDHGRQADRYEPRMSPLASCVGSDCMATLVTTRKSPSDGSAAHARPKKSSSGASAQRYPIAARSPYVDDRGAAAANAVATAFARIIAERYPGTSWLPVKSSRSNDRFVVPAGKVLRLLPGPADMDTDSGIGHPAAPTAH
jgi:hypothetical protein